MGPPSPSTLMCLTASPRMSPCKLKVWRAPRGRLIPRTSRRKRRASRSMFASAADGRWPLAASCAIDCWGGGPRTSTSRCSASPRSSCRRCCSELGRVEPVGQAFPVFKLGAIDVALPRRESKTGRGHKGFAVEGDPFMSFEEAARRRDFTINAIGVGPAHRRVPGSRSTGARPRARESFASSMRSRFADDSLRVLRALQFAARFETHARASIVRHLPRDRAGRSARRTRLGRVREAAADGRAPVNRLRPRARAGRDRAAAARDGAALRPARRIRSGIPKATSGRTR